MKRFTNISIGNKFSIYGFWPPILIIVLYLFICFLPKVKGLLLLLPKVYQLKAQIINVEKEWKNFDGLKAQVLQLQGKMDDYEKKLPSEKEIPAVLEYLSEAAKRMNVNITEIKPLEQIEHQEKIYYSLPILIRAESGYHQLGRFLNELENADRFMKISDIEILANPKKTNVHKVQLIVVTYVMKR